MTARIADSGRAVAPRPPYSPPIGRRVPTSPLKRGVTLVELLISMLILTIVCIAWLQIIGIQSARKEARRREAVERLAGMMDAFMHMGKLGKINNKNVSANKYYVLEDRRNIKEISFKEGDDSVQKLFNLALDHVDSPIGYRLHVVNKAGLLDDCLLGNDDLFGANWGASKWLVGRLYDRNGSVAEAGKPFFTLPVCLGL